MTKLSDELGTQYFQLSPVSVGALAIGSQDIKLCIANILKTIPGTDPFRPLFGCYAYLYTDRPITESVPNIKKEVFEALSIWEERIEVVEITHTFGGDGQTIYEISYKIIDDDFIDSVVYAPLPGTVTGQAPGQTGNTIISAVIPVKVAGGVYAVKFIADGKEAYPAFPSTGFGDINELVAWLKANWFNYGQWYQNGTTLYLYLKSGIAEKVSLSVSQVVKLVVKVSIPSLYDNNPYKLSMFIEGDYAQPAFPDNEIRTAGALLAWVQSNWGSYGSWSIISDGATFDQPGDFEKDFNTDFNISNGVVDSRTLVFQTEKYQSVTLTFI